MKTKAEILHKLFGTVFVTDIIADEFGSELPEWIQKKEIVDKHSVV